MNQNYGRAFEREFKESAEKQGIWIMKIADTYVPAHAASESAFVPKQPCDFVAHFDGTLWLLELKSTQNRYITIERDGSNGMIKQHQYQQMYKHTCDCQQEKGMLVLQFEREYTYGLLIQDFYRFLQETDKKSINKLDVVQYGGFNVEQKLARTHYYYNVKKLLTSN